jgi:hypothetical protein
MFRFQKGHRAECSSQLVFVQPLEKSIFTHCIQFGRSRSLSIHNRTSLRTHVLAFFVKTRSRGMNVPFNLIATLKFRDHDILLRTLDADSSRRSGFASHWARSPS